MADEEDAKEYRWESGYEKTWEAIKEDDDGLLESNVAELVARAKRKRAALKASGAIQLGMMRHLFIIVDSSECMFLQDLKPTRFLCVLKLLEIFVHEFFDLNPISQLGILTTKLKRSDKITVLAGNQKKHIETLQQLRNSSCEGEPSLQNSLEMAINGLKNMPAHTSREVLVLFGSLTTCDPGDIQQTIKSLKEHNIRVSIIGLAAEVRICREIAKKTGGTYSVLLDDHHLKELILNQVQPPAVAGAMEASLVKMGFPGGTTSAQDGGAVSDSAADHAPAYCLCHIENENANLVGSNGYNCPQCGSRYCELPVECKQCGLTLVSAPHLARSYHHLFPIKPFIEREYIPEMTSCFACAKTLSEAEPNVYECGICHQIVCLDCDLFIRETLHTCPGCASDPIKAQMKTK
uniref:General transcription factor IIH subunit n=1 Tax=Ceriodaphnia reticulata TaxID=302197 RepID=A0A4Y7LTZ1_9CRUS|nr:EOG090X05VA [Ceriodaphnia reticulata]SVE72927.1 EOG090X05VA [Ceriodaphnia reticulata]